MYIYMSVYIHVCVYGITNACICESLSVEDSRGSWGHKVMTFSLQKNCFCTFISDR